MSNNKQALDLTDITISLPVATQGLSMEDPVGLVNAFKPAAVPQNLVQSAEASTTTPTVNESDNARSRMVGRRLRDVKPGEKNVSLDIPEINQPDVTTPNEASTASSPIIYRVTEVQPLYNVDESDDETIGFLLDCAERGQNRSNQRPPSICKVSRILRDHSESSYEPQLVSIGPIHRENEKLQEFELLKECYLNDLLHRCHDSTPRETLEACLLKVNTLLPQVRESYAGMIENYRDADFARMMVMDGCFILEFCFKHEEENLYLPNKMQNSRIAMDLMLLENQIPFFVLQALFDCSMGKGSFTLSNVLDKYLASYIKLFHSQLPEKNSTTDVVDSDSTHDHILGYLHKRYQLVVAKSSNPIHAEASKLLDREGIENTYTTFHSIVELDRSGMNFKPHQEYIWSMTIKFQSSLVACLPWFGSKPTLLMPTLVIDDITELILRNFIAYEQLFPKDHYYFTSYAHAMDMLIDTQEDIAKLVESKVLVNILGSNQEAADMINKICKNISITDFYYTQEFKQMDTYYNGYWPKNIARLRRIYFNNPWNAIALLAAIILFFLTVVQTLFAIMAA
ncbi:hypothetical protein CTI12_AA522390 [Artemisia annua]|uniref:Uncharacterized protein n=1 Tax=Artemisia annua TaxID=35608 RepID=A0A2U1L684_ARTAN|nr:hypothetical protein CTI12_AA522390 [Artemisia annua]